MTDQEIIERAKKIAACVPFIDTRAGVVETQECIRGLIERVRVLGEEVETLGKFAAEACEDRHIGGWMHNGTVRPTRAWVERNGKSGPVNSDIMRRGRERFGVTAEYPEPPAATDAARGGTQ